MLTLLRREADTAAQTALRRLVDHHARTGQWDQRLWAEYHAAEQLLDMIEDRIRDMMADTDPSEGERDPLPDVPLADPGDHFAYPGVH